MGENKMKNRKYIVEIFGLLIVLMLVSTTIASIAVAMPPFGSKTDVVSIAEVVISEPVEKVEAVEEVEDDDDDDDDDGDGFDWGGLIIHVINAFGGGSGGSWAEGVVGHKVDSIADYQAREYLQDH